MYLSPRVRHMLQYFPQRYNIKRLTAKIRVINTSINYNVPFSFGYLKGLKVVFGTAGIIPSLFTRGIQKTAVAATDIQKFSAALQIPLNNLQAVRKLQIIQLHLHRILQYLKPAF